MNHKFYLLKVGLALVTCVAGIMLTSCGTIRGFGHDVHRTGRAIERSVD